MLMVLLEPVSLAGGRETELIYFEEVSDVSHLSLAFGSFLGEDLIAAVRMSD